VQLRRAVVWDELLEDGEGIVCRAVEVKKIERLLALL
jgi:hypothetical protein